MNNGRSKNNVTDWKALTVNDFEKNHLPKISVKNTQYECNAQRFKSGSGFINLANLKRNSCKSTFA